MPPGLIPLPGDVPPDALRSGLARLGSNGRIRPDAVDRLALGLVNRRILTGKHFDHGADDKGVCLTWEGMTLF